MNNPVLFPVYILSNSIERQIPNSISSIQTLQDSNKSNPYTGLDRLLGLQEFGAPRISRQSAHAGAHVVSPEHWPPLTRDVDLVFISVRSLTE